MDLNMAQLRNPHPGEILKEELLNPIGMSQNQLAHAIGVPGNRIHAIVNGTPAITGDTDLRFCKYPGAVAAVRAPIFEEKVVDFLIELATVTEKHVSLNERTGRGHSIAAQWAR
jgi:addiction module HigA family antidote